MRILIQRHNCLYENEQGMAVIVNGDHYRAMLNEFLFTKIKEFQQDGVTCHKAEAILEFCALCLKIGLSAVKLMLFVYFGAAI